MIVNLSECIFEWCLQIKRKIMGKDKFKELRKKAEELLNQNKVTDFTQHTDNLEQLLEELSIYQIEIELQNQELQLANQKLTEQRERFENLYMEAPIAYFTLNKTGNIIELNKAAAQLLGLPVYKYKYASIFPFIAEESKRKFVLQFQKLFTSTSVEYGEIIFVTNENKKVYTRLNAVCYFDTEMNESLCRCAVTDISEIVQFKDKIELQQEIIDVHIKYKSLIDDIPVLICEYLADSTLTFVNKAYCEYFGKSEEELLRTRFVDLIPENERQDALDFIASLSIDNPVKSQIHKVLKGENVYYHEWLDIALFDEKGTVIKYRGIGRDVTAKMQAENNIGLLNNRLEATMIAGNMAWWELELPSGKVNFNANKTEMLGFSAENFIHYSHFTNLVHPDDFEPMMESMRNHIAGKTDRYSAEYRIRTAKGNYIWFYDIGRVYEQKNGSTLINGIVIDITERKLAEFVLRDSELKFRKVVEHLPIGLIKLNPEGRIVEWNNAMKNITGIEKELVQNKHLWDVAQDFGSNQVMKLQQEKSLQTRITDVMQGKNQDAINVIARSTIPMPNGSVKHIESINFIIEGIKGNRMGIIVQDVTERINILEQLKESEEKFRAISENASEGVVLIDSEGIILFSNPIIHQILELPSDKIIGQNFQNFISLDTNNKEDAKLLNFWKDVQEGKQAKTKSTIFLKNHNDVAKYLEISVSTMPHHQTLYVVGVINDITLLKNNELKLLELNATKDKFFSIIAHDLKNPFNVILGFSELLIANHKRYGADKVESYLNLINNSAKNTYALLENLLTWSQAQSGRLTINAEFFNFSITASEVYTLLSDTAHSKKIELFNHLPQNIPVFADKNMMHTVLRNLVTNAIKFTPSGGSINLNFEVNDNFAHIVVADTGTGMNEEKVNSLFKIESTKSTEGTDGERGTGLGLLLCKEFVEKNGGHIWVKSQLNVGSQFWFSIPLQTDFV